MRSEVTCGADLEWALEGLKPSAIKGEQAPMCDADIKGFTVVKAL